MEALERFYLKYIPKGWGIIWFASLLFVNGLFWLYEDYTNMEHKVYWYDVVQLMVWILIGAVIYYAGEKTNEEWDVIDRKNGDIILRRKANQ